MAQRKETVIFSSWKNFLWLYWKYVFKLYINIYQFEYIINYDKILFIRHGNKQNYLSVKYELNYS